MLNKTPCATGENAVICRQMKVCNHEPNMSPGKTHEVLYTCSCRARVPEVASISVYLSNLGFSSRGFSVSVFQSRSRLSVFGFRSRRYEISVSRSRYLDLGFSVSVFQSRLSLSVFSRFSVPRFSRMRNGSPIGSPIGVSTRHCGEPAVGCFPISLLSCELSLYADS